MGLEFDNDIPKPCVIPLGTDPTTCRPDDGIGGDPGDDDDPPSDDDRCADPAFADANPDICAGYPRLILKPEYALVETGRTIQYATYLRANGSEVELTNGLTYTSADPAVAVIEASGGLATGVQPGITGIAVAWQNLNAFAQIEVVAACAELTTDFLILIDDSKSMKARFSSSYANRLTFAKAAATAFANTVNYSKDRAAVGTFTTVGAITQELTDDADLVVDAINAITTTDEQTDIAAGLQKGIDYLDGSSAGIKVIILFSDGENHDGADPVPIATAFKERGGVIVGVAINSWGQYFDLMYRIASGGYFLSAYQATQAEVITTLQGLRSYLCSGDCNQTPGTYSTGQLNYTGFINWDVFQGAVDLVGLGFLDVQPGNGLYVDLVGTLITGDPDYGTIDQVSPGGLSSKDTFDFTSGKTYRFSIDVAGNNVGNTTDIEAVKVTIKDADENIVYTRTITPTSDTMPFTTYEEEFTADDNYTDCKIYIEAIEEEANNVGPLIDNVVLENVTDALTMLTDDFDDENPTVIPPDYQYAYGCLETPPGAQSAAPNPPTPPLEQ